MPFDRRLNFFDRFPFGILDFLHEVRLHQIAAVRYGADACNELDWRNREVLPERRDRQIHRAHRAVGVEEDILAFARQVDARFLGEAERLVILPKAFRTDKAADLHKRRVAGIPDSLLKRLHAVSPVLMAADCARPSNGTYEPLHEKRELSLTSFSCSAMEEVIISRRNPDNMYR